MIRKNIADDTPLVPTMQVRIAMLVSGLTCRDIARELGCSAMTVSRTMRNHPHHGPVTDQVRSRLLSLASQVNPQQESQ